MIFVGVRYSFRAGFSMGVENFYIEKGALFPFPPTSHKRQFYGVTRGFTRLIMKTKNVCHGLISSHANFCNIRIK